MASVDTALAVAFALAGLVLALFASYLAVLTVAALLRRERAGAPAAPHTRVAVVVPAHDEAKMIASTVGSLLAQTYPRELFEVVVVADNCSDDTAALAEAAGARVLVRHNLDERGKGFALRHAMDLLLHAPDAPDALAVVDADTYAAPDFLARMVARLEAGARVVQGESQLREDGSARTALRVAAFLLINRVRPTGRAVLGLPCTLCGNGMLFERALLLERPWDAYTAAEDLEYTIGLRRAGIGPAYARGAILLSAAAPDAAAQDAQQLRWEGGKTHLARAWVPKLVVEALRARRPALLDVAFELALPPLGLLVGAALAGLVASAALALLGAFGFAVPALFAYALAAVVFYVFAGFKAAGAPASSYRAMAQAPALIVRKFARLRTLLGFRADTWVRTARTSGEVER